MKMQRISLVLVVTLLGCSLGLFSRRAPSEDDESIVFPRFFEHDAVEVGARNEPYELDGEMLQALVVASNDYLPPSLGKPPCPSRQEAQFYRLIRQGSIIFIYIYENHGYCGRQYPVRHSGAKYAISTDGRILRRIIGDQPEEPLDASTPDDGGGGFVGEPGVSPTFEAIWNQPRDGGTAPATPPGGDAG